MGKWKKTLNRLVQMSLFWKSMLTGALAALLCLIASALISTPSLSELLAIFVILPAVAMGLGVMCALVLYPLVKLCLQRKAPLHATFCAFVPILAAATLSGLFLEPTGTLDHIPAAVVATALAAILICVICAFSLPNSAPAGTHPHCKTCGYDLHANITGTCPECGAAITPRATT